MNIPYSIFETDFKVRPDDIDMFQHVHNSKYFDYVLAARYDQMERFYGMPMEEFMSQGYGWVVRTAYVDYKRALTMSDEFTVRTGIESFADKGCRVQFEIINKKTKKVCCDGWFDYTLIDTKTGRGVKVSEEMVARYTI
ncbi:acyl-CoA thioesterase [Mucilaginibacter arboris]|uniref:Acyl-CoA thioesterase n=1 Tax=Mucilaginibacter arboris TaxID=2682090 RepID=A0A7K1T0J6_9SPHI|nr:acyl-CoA thioesterase [Mucilaginibacter arboris]MVN23092.1 acyl-CoA thioesterase [Mucilaginibacter arboris]